jgi:hypothetical protein
VSRNAVFWKAEKMSDIFGHLYDDRQGGESYDHSLVKDAMTQIRRDRSRGFFGFVHTLSISLLGMDEKAWLNCPDVV